MSDLELVNTAPPPEQLDPHPLAQYPRWPVVDVLDKTQPQLSSGQTSPLGQPMKALPGAFALPFGAYLKHPALSRSTLEKIRKSPLHLQHYLKHGEPDTAAFLSGRVLHRLLLEPKEFWLRTVVWKGGDKVKNAGKWKQFKLENADKDIITAEDEALFREIEETWNLHPQTKGVTAGAALEAAAFWRTADIPCKGRADIVQGDVIFDLKTTTDISTWERDAFKWGYHRQAAWYLDGFTKATGRAFREFKFIVVEKSAPADFAIWTCGEDFIQAGREENVQNLGYYQRCLETGEWPGFAPVADLVLTLPAWRKQA